MLKKNSWLVLVQQINNYQMYKGPERYGER